MSEYYDPTLYLSTPEFPNTMGMEVILKENVDGCILSEAVESLRERFPYFYVRARKTENDIIVVPNPLPMTVRHTWEPVIFNTEESHYHLMAVKYEGKRLAVEINHYLTDGAGFLPYMKSLLFLYLSRKTGRTLDPLGFRLPGQPIPRTETGDPFAGLDIDAVKAPFYEKKPIVGFYRLNPENVRDGHCFYMKLPEEEVMRCCRDNDASPNVLFSVLIARAVRRIDPESEKTISIAIGVDHKAMLGNYDNYRMYASTAKVDFPKCREKEDIRKMCTITRGKLMLQVQPENSLWYLKTVKTRFDMLKDTPLEEKADWVAKEAALPRFTATVSYLRSKGFGQLDQYIEEIYTLADPGVTDVVCEVCCMNHCFYLLFLQSFGDQRLFHTFIRELSELEIPCEVKRREQLRLSSISWKKADQL